MTQLQHDATRYADHYDKHPRCMPAAANGWTCCGADRCNYTGLSAAKLSRRIRKDRTLRKRERGRRKQLMQQANQMHRQDMVAALICATRTPSIKQKGAKRAGAKAVQKLEALPVGTTVLEPKDATLFKALAARGNYLA